MSQRTVTINCYDSIDRDVGNGGNSGRVYVPKSWVGRKVIVMLMEPPKDEQDKKVFVTINEPPKDE